MYHKDFSIQEAFNDLSGHTSFYEKIVSLFLMKKALKYKFDKIIFQTKNKSKERWILK